MKYGLKQWEPLDDGLLNLHVAMNLILIIFWSEIDESVASDLAKLNFSSPYISSDHRLVVLTCKLRLRHDSRKKLNRVSLGKIYIDEASSKNFFDLVSEKISTNGSDSYSQ